MAGRYNFTAKRKAAFKKAQLIAARMKHMKYRGSATAPAKKRYTTRNVTTWRSTRSAARNAKGTAGAPGNKRFGSRPPSQRRRRSHPIRSFRKIIRHFH